VYVKLDNRWRGSHGHYRLVGKAVSDNFGAQLSQAWERLQELLVSCQSDLWILSMVNPDEVTIGILGERQFQYNFSVSHSGTLALQGAFIEHQIALQKLALSSTITAILVRSGEDLAVCDALIIPGGGIVKIHHVHPFQNHSCPPPFETGQNRPRSHYWPVYPDLWNLCESFRGRSPSGESALVP
jgi:hypothetical protein